MDALDHIDAYIERLPNDTTIKLGIAQVIAAMTRTIDQQALWSTVWEDMYRVQGQRRGRATQADAVEAIAKSWNRVKTLLLAAARLHDRPRQATPRR